MISTNNWNDIFKTISGIYEHNFLLLYCELGTWITWFWKPQFKNLLDTEQLAKFVNSVSQQLHPRLSDTLIKLAKMIQTWYFDYIC